jgi:hypothetical protein
VNILAAALCAAAFIMRKGRTRYGIAGVAASMNVKIRLQKV